MSGMRLERGLLGRGNYLLGLNRKPRVRTKCGERERGCTAGTGQFCGAQNPCKIQCTIIKFYI